MDLQLTNRHALITGGAAGVGAAIAQALAGEGARVTVADVNFHAAKAVANHIGGHAVAMDVSDRSSVENAFDAAASHWGLPQIIVSNVGLTLPDYFHEMLDTDIDRTFAVNMRGPLNVTRTAATRLAQAQWGRLIYIGSGSGLKASAGLSLYSASKYFLHGLCVAAGLELGPSGITANILCPSDIYPEGNLPAGSWKNEKLIGISLKKDGASDFASLKAKRIARIPAGRGCLVQDVADMAAFLCSPRADFINAQVIGINGGGLPN